MLMIEQFVVQTPLHNPEDLHGEFDTIYQKAEQGA